MYTNEHSLLSLGNKWEVNSNLKILDNNSEEGLNLNKAPPIF